MRLPYNVKKRVKRAMIAGLTRSVLYGIEFHIPDPRQEDTGDKEDQSRHKNTAVVVLFSLLELARAVIGVELVAGSAHGDKGEHDVSENESNAYERTLSASQSELSFLDGYRHRALLNEDEFKIFVKMQGEFKIFV